MSVLLAVLVVASGSLMFRLTPLLAARRLPDRLARLAGWAGLAVLAAMTLRAVLQHRDPAVPGAPLVAGVAVGCGLALAFAGRSTVFALAAGSATYLALCVVLSPPS